MRTLSKLSGELQWSLQTSTDVLSTRVQSMGNMEDNSKAHFNT